eukprot:CAMPEP_0119052046 /NCGR_PEP_ID=MMETSP1177-20130426/73478_1 /TAXON_ID=2985 /ORGANISM="Ochromonas sp, Strain CCMP1899" /LENGTH=77 /DNA_ID=CAMNT_0007031487 /DNA_START=2357 /DNA_END=2590 /DNA_ORIENTATION=+
MAQTHLLAGAAIAAGLMDRCADRAGSFVADDDVVVTVDDDGVVVVVAGAGVVGMVDAVVGSVGGASVGVVDIESDYV